MNSLFQAISSSASKPALSAWAGRPIKLTDGAFWSQIFGMGSSSGKVVTVDSAMRVAAVWSCVRLIAETVATLPISVYKRMPDGGRQTDRDLAIYSVLHDSPNADMTAVQFWEAILGSLLLRGNSFCEIHRSAGVVVALDFLNPSKMRICTDTGRMRFYYQGRQGEREIPADRMWHIPAFSLDGRIGLSPIAYGANVFGSAMAADDAANSTFENGLMPTVAFKVERTMNPKQREEFREYVKEVSGAMNAGKSPVLEQGVTPEMIGIDPTDAQLLESRGWSVEEVCRWFRVPPWMAGHTEKSTSWGSGIEQQMIGFLTFTLAPWLRRIEQSVHKNLLSPSQRITHYAEFAIEGLLRADSASRSEFYSKMTQNGIYSRDDCRVRENLPRKGGNADVLTVQTNLTPLDLLGQKP